MTHDTPTDPTNIEVILVVGSNEPVWIPFDDLEVAREFAEDRNSLPNHRAQVCYE